MFVIIGLDSRDLHNKYTILAPVSNRSTLFFVSIRNNNIHDSSNNSNNSTCTLANLLLQVIAVNLCRSVAFVVVVIAADIAYIVAATVDID